MRVCLDATPLDNAHRTRGIGRYVQGLVEALARQPLPFPIVQLRRPWAETATDGTMEAAKHWRPTRPRVRLQWLWNEILLPREVAATRCQIYHANDPQAIVCGRGYATVATAYDLAHLRFPKVYYDGAPVDIRLGLRRMERNYQQAEHVIAISEATKYEFVTLLGIAPERVTVVYPGFNPDRFGADSGAIPVPDIPQRFFLYAGALDPRKNPRAMLEAFAQIRHRVPESFVLAGNLDAAESAALRRWIAELGLSDRIVVTGYLPDAALGALYRAATAFVFPSRYEGFGLPVLEAMACGCPVLTSTLSCLPEVAGGAALTVHPDDTEAVATALCQLSEDEALRAELRERGRARAREFTWERCAAQTLKVYERVGNGG